MAQPAPDDGEELLADVTAPEPENVTNRVLHKDAQIFCEDQSIELEYDPNPNVMASSIRGNNVGSHRVLFVFLGPSDPAINNRELTTEEVWHSFKSQGRWLRTMAICNNLLELACRHLRFPNLVSSLDDVFLMDLFPWKRWAIGGGQIRYSEKEKSLARMWYRRQKQIIDPKVIIFFNSFGNQFLGKEKRMSTSSFSTQFLVDTENIHYAVLKHPGALRLSPFEHVEDYLKTFIAMNFVLHGETSVPDVYNENAICHFKSDNSILNLLRTTRAGYDLTLQQIRDFLGTEDVAVPSDGVLRLILQPFQRFDDGGQPLRNTRRAYLYRFPPLEEQAEAPLRAEADADYDEIVDYEDDIN